MRKFLVLFGFLFFFSNFAQSSNGNLQEDGYWTDDPSGRWYTSDYKGELCEIGDTSERCLYLNLEILYRTYQNQNRHVRVLLSDGANPDQYLINGIVYEEDEDWGIGATPLMVATYYKNKRIFRLLLQNGANPAMTNLEGTANALDYAKLGDVDSTPEKEKTTRWMIRKLKSLGVKPLVSVTE